MEHIWLVILAVCLVLGPSAGFADYLIRFDGTPSTGIPVYEKIDGCRLTFVHDLNSLGNNIEISRVPWSPGKALTGYIFSAILT